MSGAFIAIGHEPQSEIVDGHRRRPTTRATSRPRASPPAPTSPASSAPATSATAPTARPSPRPAPAVRPRSTPSGTCATTPLFPPRPHSRAPATWRSSSGRPRDKAAAPPPHPDHPTSFGALGPACVAAALAGCGGGDDNEQQSDLPAAPDTIEFSTPDFKDGAAIPKALTCDGEGKPPTIVWRALPAGAVELVLVVEDPDAPDGTFTHWTAWGIAAVQRRGLAPDGQFPAGLKEGKNSAGKDGWTPPCPPEGDDAHHYDVQLLRARARASTLEPGASPEAVKAVLEGRARPRHLHRHLQAGG